MRSSRAIAQIALLVVVVPLLATVVTVLPAGAQAEERVAAVELDVLRSPNGAAVVPVRVTVVARRALDALLVVESRNSNVSWEIPLGLAANSEVTQLLAVPTQNGGASELSASVVVDGDEIADTRSNPAGSPENAVGLLGVSAPAADVQLNPSVGTASLIEMDDLGILMALDTVVASPAGVRSLTADEQSRLFQWVASGRQLAVADESGSIEEVLPAEWQATSAFVPAGTGVIRYIGTQWTENVPPGVSVAANPQMVAGWFQSSSSELLNDAGFRVPGLGVMAIMLLVYVLLAGPVTFAVLTQTRQQTLAWVVIPALAVVFALGVFGVGRLLSSGRGDGYATIVEVSPVGASVNDTVLIARSGRQTLELPEGWGLVATGLSSMNGQVGSPVVVSPTRTTGTLRFDIDAGSGGTALLTGDAPELLNALAIEGLELDGTILRGSVSNSSGEKLENVTVLVGSRLTTLGEVEDGERLEFSFELDVNPNNFAPELRAWDVDPRNFNGFDGRFDAGDAISDGPANGSSWLEWRAKRLDTAVPDGLVTAVGWSRRLDVSLVDGSGRTALVAHAQLPVPNGPLVPAQVRSLHVMVPPQNQFGEFEAFGESIELVTQFVRPAGSDSSNLAIEVRNEVTEVELWTNDDGWRSLDILDGNGLTLVIPEESWNDDILTVRYGTAAFFGEPGQLETNLVTVNARTENVALLPPGQHKERAGGFGDFEGGPFPGGEAEFGVESLVELDQEGRFEAEGELFGTYDVWLVELGEGDRVTVRMNAGGNGFNSESLDPFLAVQDGDGSQIAENDDFDGLNSGLEFVASADGTYSIETRPLGGSRSGGTYIVTIDVEREGGSE